MRDYRKFCRPKTTKNPKVGDAIVELNCGISVTSSKEDFKDLKKFFKNYSVYGNLQSNSGNLKVYNSDLDKEMIVTPIMYNNILDKDKFPVILILSEKQDPYNEYYDYIKIGNTIWSLKNIGSDSITDSGDKYRYGKGNRKYALTKYEDNYDGLENPLSKSNDAASLILGGLWHLPTKELLEDLIENTNYSWETNYNNSGQDGGLFTDKVDSSKSMFIPAGGYVYGYGISTYNTLGCLMSSTPVNSTDFYILLFDSEGVSISTGDREYGYEVRGVIDYADNYAEVGDIICHNSVLNQNSIFSPEDWLNLDNSWEFLGIYRVTTYTKNTTSVGDIVIKSKNVITFINSSNWNNISSSWSAIGIVAIESRNTSDETVRILSLDYMDYNTPTTGNSGTGVYMYWGANGDITGINNRNQVPCMSTSNDVALTENVLRAIDYSRIPTDYFNIEASSIEGYKYTTITDGRYHPSMYLADGTINPDAIAVNGIIPGTSTEFTINNASSDFNGADNTSKIMSLCTVDTPINSYDAGNYPAAQCCSLYNKGGLSWYLPAAGELACIVSNFNKLNTSRVAVGFTNYSYSSYWYWSSTLHSSTIARYVNGSNGNCDYSSRSTSHPTNRVLAVSAF